MFSKKSNFRVYQNFLIGLVRGNIDRIVRGRITIGRQKRDRDNGERTMRKRRAQGRRARLFSRARYGMHLPDYF